MECQPLLEWLANNYKNFGATLEIITDKSQEGSQFVRGFGGIGGKLFYFYPYFPFQLYFIFTLLNIVSVPFGLLIIETYEKLIYIST